MLVILATLLTLLQEGGAPLQEDAAKVPDSTTAQLLCPSLAENVPAGQAQATDAPIATPTKTDELLQEEAENLPRTANVHDDCPLPL